MDFFGTLSKEWALDCMKELLTVNLHGNLQIVVQVHLVSPMSCSHIISWCEVSVFQELPADVVFPLWTFSISHIKRRNNKSPFFLSPLLF